MDYQRRALIATIFMALLASCTHKKYETPITKNTQQPDKVLFDSAMHDIEKGRYEVARLSLNTLMNTYESSEYMAKAKLAVADSWYREGGATGMAQAEGEYNDFVLFYPQMQEAAEAENRICDIHFKQMDKSDRDITQTLLAEDKCKALMVQYPNSKFAPLAAQRLREIQESLAEHEYVVGYFYWKREMNPAAANRLNALVDEYPLYSRSDEALYEAGDAYTKMGPRFRQRAGEMFTRVVRDYPLGARAEDAKRRLEDLEMPVPQADATAMARMKFEKENYKKPGMLGRSTGFLRGAPDLSRAAKEGAPTMADPKRTLPASIPVVALNPENGDGMGTGAATGTTEVSASTAPAGGALDTNRDARAAGTASAPPTTTAAVQAPLPTNRDSEIKRMQKEQAKKRASLEKKGRKKMKRSDQPNTAAAATNQKAGPVSTEPAPNQITTPNSATTGATPGPTQQTPQQ